MSAAKAEVPSIPTALPPWALVAVVGAGAMGAGIAQVAALAGHRVVLHDARTRAATQAVTAIGDALAKLVAKGKLDETRRAEALERLHAADTLEDCAGAALVIEAIAENLDAKRELFAALERIVSPDAILATNTSSISVTRIGAALAHPSRLVGMHFFNPAPVMQLVEVVSGLATSAEVAEKVQATARAWGKEPVHAKSTPGFIVNRVARPFYAEGLRLLTEGAGDAATLDAVMRECGGFKMGPFELMDLIGHDVNYAVTSSVFDAFYGDPRFTPSLIQLELVDAGRLGRKSGRGFYDHAPGAATPVPAAEPAAGPPLPAKLYAQPDWLRPLMERLGAASCVESALHAGPGNALAEIYAADVALCLTDGRTATERARTDGRPNTVLLDLALDWARSRRVAIACADSCSPAAKQAVVALLQAADWTVTVLDDAPGLAVMRTVAMLANEAADAVLQGVCNAEAVDLAMCKGVNYPRGPLDWARTIGLQTVCGVLHHLQQTYGEDRYRASAWLRRRAAAASLVAA